MTALKALLQRHKKLSEGALYVDNSGGSSSNNGTLPGLTPISTGRGKVASTPGPHEEDEDEEAKPEVWQPPVKSIEVKELPDTPRGLKVNVARAFQNPWTPLTRSTSSREVLTVLVLLLCTCSLINCLNNVHKLRAELKHRDTQLTAVLARAEQLQRQKDSVQAASEEVQQQLNLLSEANADLTAKLREKDYKLERMEAASAKTTDSVKGKLDKIKHLEEELIKVEQSFHQVSKALGITASRDSAASEDTGSTTAPAVRNTSVSASSAAHQGSATTKQQLPRRQRAGGVAGAAAQRLATTTGTATAAGGIGGSSSTGSVSGDSGKANTVRNAAAAAADGGPTDIEIQALLEDEESEEEESELDEEDDAVSETVRQQNVREGRMSAARQAAAAGSSMTGAARQGGSSSLDDGAGGGNNLLSGLGGSRTSATAVGGRAAHLRGAGALGGQGAVTGKVLEAATEGARDGKLTPEEEREHAELVKRMSRVRRRRQQQIARAVGSGQTGVRRL